MPSHVSITDPNLHEPKGVAAAAVDRVYVSNGAGSGAWQKIEADQIDIASIFNSNKGTMNGFITDISTAQTIYFVFPFACTIGDITTVLGGAITVANSVLTITKTGGGSLGTITITQSGSAEGDIDSLTPSSNNTLTANQWLKVVNDGGSTTAQPLSITVEYTRTSA